MKEVIKLAHGALFGINALVVGCGDGAINREPEEKILCASADPLAEELTDDCDLLRELFDSELAELRQCASAADCGRTFSTSCGCTRNAVLRRDADANRLCLIQQTMLDRQCPQLMSTCDCPEADGFVCEHGRCGWNYI